MHKLKDDMIGDDKNNGCIMNYKSGSLAWNMLNNTAIAIVILNNRNLLVYFVFGGYRTKQARYSSLQL